MFEPRSAFWGCHLPCSCQLHWSQPAPRGWAVSNTMEEANGELCHFGCSIALLLNGSTDSQRLKAFLLGMEICANQGSWLPQGDPKETTGSTPLGDSCCGTCGGKTTSVTLMISLGAFLEEACFQQWTWLELVLPLWSASRGLCANLKSCKILLKISSFCNPSHWLSNTYLK